MKFTADIFFGGVRLEAHRFIETSATTDPLFELKIGPTFPSSLETALGMLSALVEVRGGKQFCSFTIEPHSLFPIKQAITKHNEGYSTYNLLLYRDSGVYVIVFTQAELDQLIELLSLATTQDTDQ